MLFRSLVKKDPLHSLAILLVIILAIFFRTYNYQGRIFLQADNSQHAQVASFAADNFKLPLAGPFSSGAPFYYGPWHFWFLEILSFLPFGFLTYWYAITSLHLVFVVLIFYLGTRVGGKWVGIISALFASISPVQINDSFAVWSPTVIPLIALLVLIFLVRFHEKKKVLDLSLLAFFVGLAITIHFQSIIIIPAILVAFLALKPATKNYLKYLPVAIVGFLTPFTPLIYLDARLYWYNFKSVFIYVAIDQFSSYVPNRWLTYVFSYWPSTWAYIVGGVSWLALTMMVLVAIFALANLTKFKLSKNYYLIVLTFFLEFVLFRYFRGQRFQYYSFFAHGPIIILSAWSTFQLFKFRKIFGLIFILLIFVFTFKVSLGDLKSRGVTLEDLNLIKEEIYSKFPGQNFNVYGCQSNPNSVSHPMALLMYREGRDSVNGVKIGLCEGIDKIDWEPLTTLGDEKNILWYERSTERVYYDTAEWWLKTPPSNGGNFREFLRKNLSPGCWPHC